MKFEVQRTVELINLLDCVNNYLPISRSFRFKFGHVLFDEETAENKWSLKFNTHTLSMRGLSANRNDGSETKMCEMVHYVPLCIRALRRQLSGRTLLMYRRRWEPGSSSPMNDVTLFNNKCPLHESICLSGSTSQQLSAYLAGLPWVIISFGVGREFICVISSGCSVAAAALANTTKAMNY